MELREIRIPLAYESDKPIKGNQFIDDHIILTAGSVLRVLNSHGYIGKTDESRGPVPIVFFYSSIHYRDHFYTLASKAGKRNIFCLPSTYAKDSGCLLNTRIPKECLEAATVGHLAHGYWLIIDIPVDVYRDYTDYFGSVEAVPIFTKVRSDPPPIKNGYKEYVSTDAVDLWAFQVVPTFSCFSYIGDAKTSSAVDLAVVDGKF